MDSNPAISALRRRVWCTQKPSPISRKFGSAFLAAVALESGWSTPHSEERFSEDIPERVHGNDPPPF